MPKILSVGDQITLEENIEGDSYQFYRGDTVRIVKMTQAAALVEGDIDGVGKLQDWILIGEEGELVGR